MTPVIIGPATLWLADAYQLMPTLGRFDALCTDPAHKIRTSGGGSYRRHGHATPKPLGLMQKIVRNLPGETILDPFMGTGTTGVAAIMAGRTFTGIEHNPTHFETAVQRIRAAALACERERPTGENTAETMEKGS